MHKHRCIFIHIPKNAGTSVNAFFEAKGGRKHAKWHEFYESNYHFFRNYHKFAIVRHPLDRLRSAYDYLVNGGNGLANDEYMRQLLNEQSDSFEDFVMNVLDYELIIKEIKFQPQYMYLCNVKNDLMVDTLLRYESLNSDWQTLMGKMNLTGELPRINATSATDEESNTRDTGYSDECRERVYSLYKLDYELFGYDQ